MIRRGRVAARIDGLGDNTPALGLAIMTPIAHIVLLDDELPRAAWSRRTGNLVSQHLLMRLASDNDGRHVRLTATLMYELELLTSVIIPTVGTNTQVLIGVHGILDDAVIVVVHVKPESRNVALAERRLDGDDVVHGMHVVCA